MQKGEQYWALPPSLDAHQNLSCHQIFTRPTLLVSAGFSRIVFARSLSAMSPLWPALLLTKGQADGLQRPRDLKVRQGQYCGGSRIGRYFKAHQHRLSRASVVHEVRRLMVRLVPGMLE